MDKNYIYMYTQNSFRFFNKEHMPDVSQKYENNVAGKFYVDSSCIDCDLCREHAPDFFKRDDDGGHSYVYRQPENEEQEAKCDEALAACPVEAIGSDGLSS
jgi:ferredoxin